MLQGQFGRSSKAFFRLLQAPRSTSYDHHPSQLILNICSSRSHSTRSNDPLFKFISAASFIGKPLSQQEVMKADEGHEIKLTRYQEWVLAEKKKWIKNYLERYKVDSPPKFEIITNSGHDWWFINDRNESTQTTYLGVADGVGGWIDSGIDPAEVSQGLMFHADQILEEHATQNKKDVDQTPNSILSQAHQRMLQDSQVQGGSSTALLARLDSKLAKLQWANMGDSSLLLIKGGQSIGTRTKSQTHYFNCPYQLTKFPDRLPSDGIETDTPEMAHCGSVTLDDGDLVMLFTDGLGDNLWPEDILSVVGALMKKNLADTDFVHDLVHSLCGYARLASLQHNRVTPFEVEARKNKIDDMKGGKVDDITLIVSLVRKLNQS